MGFYGNVSNITRSTFQFDQIYPNRLTMDAQTNEDGIYIGRYVLVEYDTANDFDVFTRIYPVNTKVGSGATAREEVYFYTAPQAPTPQTLELVKGQAGKYYYSADEDATASYTGLTNLIFYKCEKDGAYILGEGDETESAKGFTKIAELGTTDAGDYTVNYNLDLNKYNNSRGYDSTVWMKTYAGDEIKYVMIAELNTVVPTFDVSVDPPSEIPNQPHFGKDSTNVYYDLHVQPSWGFRIKEAKDETGNRTPSDEKVYHNSSYYDINGIEQKAENVSTEVDGDIYYNAKGFDVDYSNHETKLTDIIKLTKGQSGRAYNYHDPKTEITTLKKADDIQELSIHLPAIGNAVAHLYDVLYGDGSDSKEGNKRNKNIDWYYHGYLNEGLRLSEFFDDEVDEETGQVKEGYRYYPDRMKTVAASINTLHDFIGMIIDENSYKSSKYKDDTEGRQQQFIDTSDENTIYYDSDTSKYYRKVVGYNYIEQVNYDYSPATVNKNNYQPNLYFVKDGTGFKPDEGTEYQEINYYARKTLNDEYYDKVQLTDYNPNDFYSLVNGVFTKSTGKTFEKALNYYRLNKGTPIIFNGSYIADTYYKKDIDNDTGIVKYTLFKEKFDQQNHSNLSTIYDGLSAIGKQSLYPVQFYQAGLWFHYVDNDKLKGYFIDNSFDEKKTYYLISKVVKTEIPNTEGQMVEIYQPASGATITTISPKPILNEDSNKSIPGYTILNMADQEKWKNYIFKNPKNNDGNIIDTIFMQAEAVKTTMTDNGDGTYNINYNNQDTIWYKEFEPVKLYTPDTYYSEDATNQIKFSKDADKDLSANKNYYNFDPDDKNQVQAVHDNKENYFYEPCPKGQVAPQIGYYFTKDDDGYHIMEQEKVAGLTDTFYKLSSNDLYVMADTNHIYDKYTVWNSNASIVPASITLNRRKEKYVFEELKEFGIQYNTLLGILLEARRVLSTSLDTPEETRDTSTVQGCINKLNDIFAYFDNRYPGQFLITDAYDRIVNAPITTAQVDTITNIGTTTTTTITPPMENRWIEVNINSDPVNPQIKYQHNFNPLPKEDNTTTNANKNKQLEVDGKTEDTRGNGLNKTTGDTLSLYTPIVDGMGHIVGKNTETVILPYGYKTFTTNGVVSIDDKDLYSTINLNENGANTTTVSNPEQTLSMASNTQDLIAIEPANKWIQTKIVEDNNKNDIISIAHAIHSVDTVKKETDLNKLVNEQVQNVITLQDMVFDKAGHIIENHPHTYTLPYGFKKVKVVNSAGASNTKELSITATTTVIADNTQDQFSIETGNRWIRMGAVDEFDNKITIQHEIHKQDTHNGEDKIDLTTADTSKTFDIKSYSFDEAGHVDGTITTTVSMPTNYGIFTDSKNTTTARGTQSAMTIKGDDIHLLPTIGTDTIMFTHIGPDTATVNTTTTLASNIVDGKEFALFGDSFTIANVSYDKQGHINGTSTFNIKIPEISATTSTAQTATKADVIKTITINSQTGEIDVSRENIGNLKLTGFTATVTTSLTAEPIKEKDDVNTAFNKIESRLNGTENKLDTLQGDGEGSVAKAIADASATLNNSITDVDNKINTINGDETTEGSIKKAVANVSTTLTEAITAVDDKVTVINGTKEQEGSIAYAISALSALIETDYVKKTDYDALKQEVDALKALVEQYHPTSTDPGEETGG